MTKIKTQVEEEIELDQINVIVDIPENTVRLDIEARILDDEDEELHKVHASASLSEINEFHNDFVENLDDEAEERDTEPGYKSIILKIPSEAVSVDLIPHLLDEKTLRVKGDDAIHLCLKDIHECRRDFLERIFCGDDYDAVFTLTDKGREAVEAIRRGEKTVEEVFGEDLEDLE